MSGETGLSIFALGHVTGDDVAALPERFAATELLAIDLPADADLSESQSLLRTSVNSARHDWIFLVRGGEVVGGDLAEEMKGALAAPPRAWGFRLRVTPTYGGDPLLLPVRHGGEIRLFHRRHVRFDVRNRTGEMNVEGAVVRLQHALTMEAFPSAEAHRAWLEPRAKRRPALGRIALFVRNAIVSGALWRSPATLRFLWIEAGWNRTPSGKSSE